MANENKDKIFLKKKSINLDEIKQIALQPLDEEKKSLFILDHQPDIKNLLIRLDLNYPLIYQMIDKLSSDNKSKLLNICKRLLESDNQFIPFLRMNNEYSILIKEEYFEIVRLQRYIITNFLEKNIPKEEESTFINFINNFIFPEYKKMKKYMKYKIKYLKLKY